MNDSEAMHVSSLYLHRRQRCIVQMTKTEYFHTNELCKFLFRCSIHLKLYRLITEKNMIDQPTVQCDNKTISLRIDGLNAMHCIQSTMINTTNLLLKSSTCSEGDREYHVMMLEYMQREIQRKGREKRADEKEGVGTILL